MRNVNSNPRVPGHQPIPNQFQRPVSARSQQAPRQVQRPTQEVREEKGLFARAAHKISQGFREALSRPQIVQRHVGVDQFTGPRQDVASTRRLQLISSGVGLQGTQARRVPISGDAVLIAALDNVIRTGNPQSLATKPSVAPQPVRPVNPRALLS